MSRAAFLVALLLSACAPSVGGTLAGRDVHLVTAVQGKFTGDNGAAWVLVSDSPDLCGDLQAKRKRPGATLLLVSLSRRSGDNYFAGTLAATYPMVAKGVESPQGPHARIGQFVWDDACVNAAADVEASSGSVVLSDDLGPGTTASGHLDLSWGDGSHLSGSFAAEPCEATFPINNCG